MKSKEELKGRALEMVSPMMDLFRYFVAGWEPIDSMVILAFVADAMRDSAMSVIKANNDVGHTKMLEEITSKRSMEEWAVDELAKALCEKTKSDHVMILIKGGRGLMVTGARRVEVENEQQAAQMVEDWDLRQMLIDALVAMSHKAKAGE